MKIDYDQKNDLREVLIFGKTLVCYLSLAQVYLEVACEELHLSMKDNNVCMNSYMLYDALVCL